MTDLDKLCADLRGLLAVDTTGNPDDDCLEHHLMRQSLDALTAAQETIGRLEEALDVCAKAPQQDWMIARGCARAALSDRRGG